MREKLRQLVEDNDTKQGRIFDYFIQALVLISLVAFSLETLPSTSTAFRLCLYVIEFICVVVFSLEYIARVYVAKKPWKYILSFYGLVDLLAILPFYISGAIDLVALRAFRIFRIFRALKLIRFNRALNRIHIAAKIVKEEVILFLIVTCIFVFLASAGIYHFENEAQPDVFTSIFSSAWWAIVTLTTVGYGDIYPITVGGKIFTFFILLIGVGIVTIPAGLVATALNRAREIEDKEVREGRTKV